MFPLANLLHDIGSNVAETVTGDGAAEMPIRALLVYLFGLALVRTGKSRMLSQATVFDIILIFVLGSMLSRMINGSAPFVPSALAAIALVALHYVFGLTAYHTNFGSVVKGKANLLIRDGQLIDGALHDHHLTRHDIEEALHANGLTRVDQVEIARLERNGEISIVAKTRIYDIEVKDGVQRVRLEV